MIAIENSLKRREETPEAIDEERFAEDIVRHLSKHFIIKDPEKTKDDLIKVLRAIKDYSSTLLSIDPIKEEEKAKTVHDHFDADINEIESSDSYLEKNAPEVFEKWWGLKTTIAEVLGTKPYRHEVMRTAKGITKKKRAKKKTKSTTPDDEILARLDRLEEKVDELTRKVDALVELLRLLSKER